MPTNSSWKVSLETREQHVVLGTLLAAGTYLQDNQDFTHRWPIRPGLPSDLHSSTLAILALSALEYQPFQLIGGHGAVALMRSNRDYLESASLETIADLIEVACVEQVPDQEYLSALTQLFKDQFEILDLAITSTVLISNVIASAWKVSVSEPDFVEGSLRYLEELQNKEDGGWAVIARGTSSVVATSLVLRVLTLGGRNTECIQRGSSFLLRIIAEETWMHLGGKNDTFTQSMVLRTLSMLPFIPDDVISAGIQALTASANSDGGWGGTVGESSNIENTSLCILALVAAGETKYIPIRFAVAAIMQVEGRLHSVTSERDQLTAKFDKELIAKSGQLLNELKELRAEKINLKDLQAQLQDKTEWLSRKFEESQDALNFESRRSRAFRVKRSPTNELIDKLVFYSAMVAVVVGITISLWSSRGHFTLRSTVLGTVTGVVLASISWLSYTLLKTRQDLRKSVEDDEFKMLRSVDADLYYQFPSSMHSEQMLEPFFRLNSRLPPSVREELIYRLSADFADMPPDIARRYSRDLVVRFSLSSEDGFLLRDWLDRMATLPPMERRVLLDSLRRASLR